MMLNERRQHKAGEHVGAGLLLVCGVVLLLAVVLMAR